MTNLKEKLTCRPKSNLRLSATEKENAIKSQEQKLLIFRKQQVRQQANERSAQIREDRRKDEESYKNIVRKQMEQKHADEIAAEKEILQKKFNENMGLLGQAHQNAKQETENEKIRNEQQAIKFKAAKGRGAIALKKLQANKEVELDKENCLIQQRQKVQNLEKERASKIAKRVKRPIPETLKPPKVTIVPPKKVQFYDIGTLTTSSYVPKNIKVLKETSNIQKSAHEKAIAITEEELQIKEQNQQKIDEKKRQTELRGKAALNTLKLTELRQQTLEKLDKADQENQLSQYLIGEERPLRNSPNDNDDEKLAEEMVERIIEEENLQHQLPIQGVSSSTTEEVSASEDGHQYNDCLYEDSQLGLQGHAPSEERISNVVPTRPPPPNICLKETVPVHILPNLSEKFKRISTDPPLTTDTTSPSTSNERDFLQTSQETEYLEINKRLSDRLNNLPKSDLKLTDVTEKLSERLTKNFPTKSNLDNLDVSKCLRDRLERWKTEHETTTSNCSSTSTRYKDLPEWEPDCQDPIYINLKKIKQKQSAISKSLATTDKVKTKVPDAKEITSYKTPPRIYSEDIKDDGSGLRPISKRRKFENIKKSLVEIYMKRLIKLNVNEITESSVEGSGINVNTKDFSKLLKTSSDASSSTCCYDSSSKSPCDSYLSLSSSDPRMPSTISSSFSRTCSSESSSRLNVTRTTEYQTPSRDDGSTSSYDQSSKSEILFVARRLDIRRDVIVSANAMNLTSTSTSSSSTNSSSMPDSREGLLKLGWMKSMNKKMNFLDERVSSDSSYGCK